MDPIWFFRLVFLGLTVYWAWRLWTVSGKPADWQGPTGRRNQTMSRNGQIVSSLFGILIGMVLFAVTFLDRFAGSRGS